MKNKIKEKILEKTLENVPNHSIPIEMREHFMRAISLTEQQMKKEFSEIIDECKIHTHGALILIEKQEILSKIIGSQKKEINRSTSETEVIEHLTENQTRGEDMPDEAPDKDSASGDNHSQETKHQELDGQCDEDIGDSLSSRYMEETRLDNSFVGDKTPDTNNSGDICKNCGYPKMDHWKGVLCEWDDERIHKIFEPFENNGGKDA